MKKVKKLKDLKHKTYIEIYKLFEFDENVLNLFENIDKNFSVVSEIENYSDCNFINYIANNKNPQGEDIKEQFVNCLNNLIFSLRKKNKKYGLKFIYKKSDIITLK